MRLHGALTAQRHPPRWRAANHWHSPPEFLAPLQGQFRPDRRLPMPRYRRSSNMPRSEWNREQGVDFMTVSYDNALEELIGCARNIDAVDVDARRKQHGVTGVHDADDQKM